MNTATKKRGRKRNPYYAEWCDTHITGLLQIKGTNRWRITEGPLAGKEWRQNDPREAVRYFYEVTGGTVDTIDIGFTPKGEAKALATIGTFTPPGEEPVKVDAPDEAIPPAQRYVRITMDEQGNLVFKRPTEQKWFFATMRKLILEQPKLCAKETGIEWLQWHKHEEPVKADTLEAIGEVYFQFNKLSPNELSRSKCFWGEFTTVAKRLGITTVDAITHDLAQAYEKYIEGQKLASKSTLHRYRKIRGVLHFAIKRGKSIEHCRKSLDVLAMLEVKDAHPLDPTPISPADFWAIHGEAMKAGDTTFAALLLMSLNAALYSGEVSALRWDEIDFTTGGFVSRRSKTGVSRIAVLWPETLKAIEPLEHMRDEVFCTKVRSYTVFSVGDKFEKYRDAAKVDKGVTFSWIRDAAYSTAMQATDFSKAELLAGHRLPGTADAYLRRNPQLVQEACEAIRREFYAIKAEKPNGKRVKP